jgi:UDP-N-acetyl-D-mannosaminuronic acid transferase (WecB/TagA/CpsF family)
MERTAVKLWYDPEEDYMEVIFEMKEGYFRETEDERVMEKIDADGNILGFSIM